jgi:hypothetical protein
MPKIPSASSSNAKLAGSGVVSNAKVMLYGILGALKGVIGCPERRYP